MKVAIEYDDFSGINHNLGILEEFHDHYPNFKVTLFTVPWEVRFGRSLKESAPITLKKFKPFVEAINKSDWMEIALHGLTHAPMEFAELSYEAAIKRVVIGMKMFENVGIKNFAKIFKAPQWELSSEARRAIENMGFVVVENGYFNWNLANDKPDADAKEPFIMHGHVQDECENGMEETMHRVLQLPTDTEFMFLSEILKSDKGVYNYYGCD